MIVTLKEENRLLMKDYAHVGGYSYIMGIIKISGFDCHKIFLDF